MFLLRKGWLGIMVGLLFVTASAANSTNSIGRTHQTLSPDRQTVATAPSPLLTDKQIEDIARQTTVVIGAGLKEGDTESGEAFRTGSGVVVAKLRNRYFVATNLHVVRSVGNGYGIRTFDGKVHFIEENQKSEMINFLGVDVGERALTIKGLDLAILQFESDKDYPIATVNLSGIKVGDRSFVSGWPNPETNVTRLDRRFSPGVVMEIRPPDPDGGYGLLYSCQTEVGMSGGPVFNDRGEVVGIHGRSGKAKSLSQVPNLGIQIIFLDQEIRTNLQIAARLANLRFNLPPVSLAMLQGQIPPEADVITNLRESFTRKFVETGVKDCPLGVSLGDRDDECRK
ncbi:hypothetical protein TUMEXPCC7403_13660 [Tumidithrix helvetica PCC 7403]|uniref:S1 family peptidase n=1 Tax=Tumidithrix helvetica TaxID=3457545 RepID=UPI003C8557D0